MASRVISFGVAWRFFFFFSPAGSSFVSFVLRANSGREPSFPLNYKKRGAHRERTSFSFGVSLKSSKSNLLFVIPILDPKLLKWIQRLRPKPKVGGAPRHSCKAQKGNLVPLPFVEGGCPESTAKTECRCVFSFF